MGVDEGDGEMVEMAEGLVGMVDMGEGAWVVEGSIYFALFPNCGQFEGCRKLKRNEICSTKYMKPLIWNLNSIWIDDRWHHFFI